jgi:hypothetical protein
MLSGFNDFDSVCDIDICNKIIRCYSKLEKKFVEHADRSLKIENILHQREIFEITGIIKYNFMEKEHIYIPDFYLKTKKEQYIIEVKSDYWLGMNCEDDTLLNKNLQKFERCDSICNEMGIKFLIYFDYQEYIFEKTKKKREMLTFKKLKDLINDKSRYFKRDKKTRG